MTTLIERTAAHVRETLEGETTGHDWWHVYRVWQNAKHINAEEHADPLVVELAALLHDIADWKLEGGDEDAGPQAAKRWLESQHADPTVTGHVVEIISTMAYRGPTTKSPMQTLEGRIVQDADRLEALGAIGIARTFATGQKLGQIIYDPAIPPATQVSAEEYRKQYTGERKNTTINHFHEKLLLLKERMNTETAKRIAAERHQFMEGFLEEFHKEWDGKA